jgi:outer membrane protein assembly factor BamB
MATLEVHDGSGRVEYVAINRENPALFGSDPKCDIVLSDPEALPFHGRIRWKRGKFKVEAFPEAKSLEVSGKKVVSTGFDRGDEIRVGDCRIFLLSPDDGPVDLEKTRVQPRPSMAGSPSEVPPKPLPRSSWRNMEVAPPSAEIPLADERRRGSPGGAGLPPRVEAPGPGALSLWRKLLRMVFPSQAPGQEKIASSPLVLGLVIALAFLVLLGVSLWGVIAKTNADRQYLQAEDSYKDGEFLNAIKMFDLFLEKNGKDPRASKARVLRHLADVKQYASGGGPVWSNALDAERDMARKLAKEPAYADYRAELGELILKTAEGLAERAKAGADAKSLEQAEAAITLHDQVAGAAASAQRSRSRLPTKLAEARAAVTKGQVRARALAAMDAALKGKSSVEVFAARDSLVDAYPDLAGDRAVIERLTKATDLIRAAVTFDETRRPAETTPRAEPLGPPTSLVIRSKPSEPPTRAGTAVFALADGFAYGLDGANGAPLWHIPVGPSSPFPPQPIPGGEAGALVFDARHNELVRVQGRTGALVWRLDLGEPIVGPPLIQGNQVVQATPAGKLLLIDLSTGELRGTLNMGRPLTRAPVSDENGQYFYVLADRDCLFLVRREPPECAGVVYLGHDAGSIACPPARLGRYLIVAENHALTAGRWTVFLLDEEGGKARKVQTVPVAGWTWDAPTSQGSVIWSAADRGGVVAYAVGPYDAKTPLTVIAQVGSEDKPSGPAFARARSDRELWVASARSARYDLNAERGTLAPGWTLGLAGHALAPIQVAGKIGILTQQATDGPGVALWGINPADGTIAWRTILGAPWPLRPLPAADGDALTTLSTDGRTVTLSRSQLASGGFVEVPIPKAVDPVLPPGPLVRLEGEGLTIIIPAPGASRLMVRDGDGPFRAVELPAPLASSPLFWGPDLFVPGADGRAYLIDPRTGLAKAEPFVPPFDRDRPTVWRAPARLEGDVVALADTSGRVRRLTRQAEPRPRIVASGDAVDLGSPIVADPASTGAALFVATDDGKIRVLSGRDLSPSGTINLEAVRRLGPVAVAERAFVADAAGTLLAFAADGRRLWSITLGDASPIGTPVVRDDSAWFLGRDGILHRLALADGSALDRVPLGVLPAGGLWPVGSDLALPVGRGTIRLWTGKPAGEGKP